MLKSYGGTSSAIGEQVKKSLFLGTLPPLKVKDIFAVKKVEV